MRQANRSEAKAKISGRVEYYTNEEWTLPVVANHSTKINVSFNFIRRHDLMTIELSKRIAEFRQTPLFASLVSPACVPGVRLEDVRRKVLEQHIERQPLSEAPQNWERGIGL